MLDISDGMLDLMAYKFKKYLGSVSREIQNRKLYEKKVVEDMGMTNEIEQLEYAILLIKQNGKDYLDERDIPILETAIATMRKYQKIKGIVKNNNSFTDGTLEHSKAFTKITEVLEDENDKRNK